MMRVRLPLAPPTRLAQRLERLVYTQDVRGSNPLSRTSLRSWSECSPSKRCTVGSNPTGGSMLWRLACRSPNLPRATYRSEVHYAHLRDTNETSRMLMHSRSSIGQSSGFLNRRSQVRILSRAPSRYRKTGRLVRCGSTPQPATISERMGKPVLDRLVGAERRFTTRPQGKVRPSAGQRTRS